MPAYKDLYDMIKSMVEKEINRIEREFKRIESEIEEEVRRSYTPLYSLYESGDSYYYLIDIPNIDMSTLYVKVEKNTLRIRGKDKSNKEYYLKIQLPEDANADSLTITRTKWLVKITVQRKKD
ncbi:hypothetical protein V6M85_00485 [Sulfolobus tengchongensis]|uniref:Hsp20/alpha crystallin family protein n=1 Tax=Sulfolobus tengchongensis TaxID=207809 RepID=A0AAX4L0V9_9CREN